MLLPVLAVLIVGVIGIYTLSRSSAATTPGYEKLQNLRDPSTSSDHMISGILYRSARLSDISSKDVKKMSKLLEGGVIIDLRGTADRILYPDKKIPGTIRKNIPVTGTTNYTKFVRNASDRAAFGNAIRTIANTKGRVLVHCTYGKDRTGWLVAMVMYSVGDSDAAVMKEYLKSSQYGAVKREWLDNGITAARDKYGSISDYIKNGLNVDDATIHALKRKLQLKTRYTLDDSFRITTVSTAWSNDWLPQDLIGIKPFFRDYRLRAHAV